MNCMNCEERRQDFLVAIRQRDEARSRLVEAVGALATARRHIADCHLGREFHSRFLTDGGPTECAGGEHRNDCARYTPHCAICGRTGHNATGYNAAKCPLASPESAAPAGTAPPTYGDDEVGGLDAKK